MFGFRLIKKTEIENLLADLANAKETVATQAKQIAELNDKVRKQEETIANLTAATLNVEKVVEEKPVKKVRRNRSKKTTKKEE